METLKDRLTEVMEDLKITRAKDLAIFCDVSEGLVTQWFSGQTNLGPKPLKAFSRTRFNIDWIADGTLPKYREQVANEGYGTSNQFSKVAVAEHGSPNLIEVRKVNLRLSAGIIGIALDQQESNGEPLLVQRSWVDKNGFIPSKLIAVAIKGDSMEPALYDGDTVIINTADCKLNDGDTYAVNYEGEAVVKRLVRDLGQWFLSSDNSDKSKYGRKTCQGSACIIIGKVVHKQSDRI
ncbi:transcriptional regulator [Undibacterium sp. YM2]|uniref:S24 family peptidase n=1 Tax=Undibacterium sp. YM2 TaxID=2058625 RepID=UPI001331F4AD|nr:LexA family transcriptional regulator [Undibacterium sp. YM2]BBB65889.1 transcriptional regulator [Undibacterium sp. YM2]